MEEEDNVGRKFAVSLGQHGGGEGDSWDDGIFSSIKEVVIGHGGCVDSIQTKYDDSGTSTWSERRGGNGGRRSEVVLEYPDEYLISIHGYLGDYRRHYVIRSLTLESNKRLYGPFGREEGTRFWFPTIGGAKIVGFHGTCCSFLESIGIKVVPIHNTTKTTPKFLH